mgnify:CR=1 FL=1
MTDDNKPDLSDYSNAELIFLMFHVPPIPELMHDALFEEWVRRYKENFIDK